ncbi:MAG TPA: alpha/beta hydrolase-fold protein [Gemmatimonadales bacterium]|nr:alpha/beta hydrolase-fold protein [Gemmatimonadales bacterium]
MRRPFPHLILSLWLTALAAPASLRSQEPADPVPPHDSLIIHSRILGEARRINIHFPPGYHGRTRLPVLYMPDGGIGEDFPHVVNTLDSLQAAGLVRPWLVVGIENTERRRDLTGPTTVASDSAIAPHVGESAAFRSFIRDELRPEIRRRYRTSGETAIVGESLAGLFIVETLLREPRLFDRYVAISPSLWWNRDELLRIAPKRLRALRDMHRVLFLTAANEPGIAAQADTLAQLLRKDAPADLTWSYRPRPDQEHSTIYRAEGPEALRTVLGRH